MKNDAIVITGIGALSPNGGDRESYFAATAEGRSGVRSITHFDSEALPCRIAGEVDFDPTQWVDPKNIRHVSRVVPMAIAASAEALRDAKLDPLAMDLEGRQSFGVMLGSGGGAVEFSERMYELWYKGAVKQATLNVRAAAGAKDVQELLAVRARIAENTLENLMGYSRSLYEVASEAQAEYSRLADERMARFQQAVTDRRDLAISLRWLQTALKLVDPVQKSLATRQPLSLT